MVGMGRGAPRALYKKGYCPATISAICACRRGPSLRSTKVRGPIYCVPRVRARHVVLGPLNSKNYLDAREKTPRAMVNLPSPIINTMRMHRP